MLAGKKIKVDMKFVIVFLSLSFTFIADTSGSSLVVSTP